MFSPLAQFQVFDLAFGLQNYFFAEIFYLFLPLFIIVVTFFYSLVRVNFSTVFQKGLIRGYYFYLLSVVLQLGNYYLFYFFILVMILFTNNVFGLFPFGFALTSQIIFTFYLAFAIFLGINIVSILRFSRGFLAHFLPNGTPFFIIPLLVMIELVSYISRLFSLAIRLFANIMSGHTLMHILLSFSAKMMLSGSRILLFVAGIPIGLSQLIFFMEAGIAILQSYVFVTLVANYLKDLVFESH